MNLLNSPIAGCIKCDDLQHTIKQHINHRATLESIIYKLTAVRPDALTEYEAGEAAGLAGTTAPVTDIIDHLETAWRRACDTTNLTHTDQWVINQIGQMVDRHRPGLVERHFGPSPTETDMP